MFRVRFHGQFNESVSYLLDSKPDRLPGQQLFLTCMCGASWSTSTCESVDCAGVSELSERPVNATFCPLIV